jgi:integrating conjugative element protein (TIGR03759 family)
MMLTVVMLLVAAIAAVPAMAQNTSTQKSELRRTHQATAVIAARHWGLSNEEWQDYQAIMQGKRGIWSPGLDPITALGVHADTDAKRQRLAELYVRQEYKRTQDELAFQKAVNRAWARLFPDLKPLQKTSGLFSPVSDTPTRYALVVKENCADCDAALRNHLRSADFGSGIGMDVYLVGSGSDDDRLRTWASDNNIPQQAVEAGRITLNHGRDFVGLKRLPVVYAKRGNGQWVQQ